MRNKLSNYINTGENASESATLKSKPSQKKNLKKNTSTKGISKLKKYGSTELKGFDSTSVAGRTDSLKSLMSNKRSPKAGHSMIGPLRYVIKKNDSKKPDKLGKNYQIEKLGTLSSTNRMKNISTLIKSIQKVKIDDPKLVSRCKKGKKTTKN